VLLIHGFASSVRHNWIEPGWVSFLTAMVSASSPSQPRPRRATSYDRALYGAPLMAEDARRLMDHLALPAPT
jgi:hypothetical protein